MRRFLTTQNYTLRSDKGLDRMSTEDSDKDDFQKRLLPLQWAIESVSGTTS